MQRRTFMQSALVGGIAAAAPTLWAQAKYPTSRSTSSCRSPPAAAATRSRACWRSACRSGSTTRWWWKTASAPAATSARTSCCNRQPDGYTLLNMSSTYPIQAAVSKLPFDPIDDMQPIIMVSRDPVVLLVNATRRCKNAKDLAEAAQALAGQAHLRLGRRGLDRAPRHGGARLPAWASSWCTCPTRGRRRPSPMCSAASVDMMLTSATFSAPHIKGGKVRGIGIAGTQRMPTLPEVPTFEEQGFAGYDVVDWKAVAGPRGMPADVVALPQPRAERGAQAQGASPRSSRPRAPPPSAARRSR